MGPGSRRWWVRARTWAGQGGRPTSSRTLNPGCIEIEPHLPTAAACRVLHWPHSLCPHLNQSLPLPLLTTTSSLPRQTANIPHVTQRRRMFVFFRKHPRMPLARSEAGSGAGSGLGQWERIKNRDGPPPLAPGWWPSPRAPLPIQGPTPVFSGTFCPRIQQSAPRAALAALRALPFLACL